MSVIPPINFKKWIKDNHHLLKPPVGNKIVYDRGDFIIMVVGGPNSRKDYHVDPVEEFFYQIEGDMILKIIEDGNQVDINIKEGEIFLLPKNIPHSPQRFKNTVGLVVEYKREEGERTLFNGIVIIVVTFYIRWHSSWKILFPSFHLYSKIIGRI